jgi:hypothetical protein
MYKEKYLKYKLKYLDLQSQLGGGPNYFYHGTNLFYIDDIIENGLTGKYNEQIYQIIEKYWPIISEWLDEHGKPKSPYVQFFLERQQKVIDDALKISLSFTSHLHVAKRYGKGIRTLGECPTYFFMHFTQYINDNKEKITDDMKKDYKTINNAYKYPQIILAINIDEFDKTQISNFGNLDEWEIMVHLSIDVEKLYIMIDDETFVSLTSDEGVKYIKNLKEDFLKKQKEEQSEIEKNKSSHEWIISKSNTPLLYTYEARNRSIKCRIYVVYDIFKDNLHYLNLSINNNNTINIDIEINYIFEENNYKIRIKNSKGYKLFESDGDLREQFGLAVNYIIDYITPMERKQKIQTNINYSLKYIKEKKT